MFALLDTARHSDLLAAIQMFNVGDYTFHGTCDIHDELAHRRGSLLTHAFVFKAAGG